MGSSLRREFIKASGRRSVGRVATVRPQEVRVISWVTCVWRESVYHRRARPSVEAQCARHGGEAIEVRHPTSIFAAYEEGRRRAQGEVVVYLHEDVELVDPETSARIEQAFARHPRLGLAGVIGSKTARFVPWWHNAQAVGQVLLPGVGPAARILEYADARGRVRQAAFDGASAFADRVGARAPGPWRAGLLDGLLLAERRREQAWDVEGYTGWHAYDIDRCLQTRQAGLEVGVLDLLTFHDQRPHDPDWSENLRENLGRARAKGGVQRTWSRAWARRAWHGCLGRGRGVAHQTLEV